MLRGGRGRPATSIIVATPLSELPLEGRGLTALLDGCLVDAETDADRGGQSPPEPHRVGRRRNANPRCWRDARV